MSERKRFNALIGWLERPTIDGRVWAPTDGTVGMRAPRIPLLPLEDRITVQPNTTYDLQQLLAEHENALTLGLGHISKVVIRVDGAVYAAGRANPEVAEALNEGALVLLADFEPSEWISVDGGNIFCTHVVLMAAHVGPPASFAWAVTA